MVCSFSLLTTLSGCKSTASALRENLDYRPTVANAISRALSLGSPATNSKITKPSLYPSIPFEENTPRVRSFIRQYAYDQRQTMKTYFSMIEKHLPMLKTEARENGLPEDVAYLVMLESGGDTEARSPANALGMWQFMPATARSYGLRVDSWVDERLDPRKSTKAAMLYLKDLYGMFGCWRLAISAYNSGENKLNKVLCQEDAQEYDEICSSRRLKRETREFFPKFLAMAVIARNPEKYGFVRRSSSVQEPKSELVPVNGRYSLESLSKSIGVQHETLQQLNPGLVRGITPPEGTPYPLRVPLGKKGVLVSKLEDLPEENHKKHVTHVVIKGDNLARILKRYRVSRSKVAELNPDVNLKHRLKQGSRLVVPVHGAGNQKSLKGQRLSRSQ